MSTLAVHLSPQTLDNIDLEGSLAIVIDLLRASTTITHALAAGAAAVAPCASIEKARDLAANTPPGTFLLGGERRGLRIEGFDLGNSPTEYTPDRIRGKLIIFTTTNGTVALHRAGHAPRVLIGCLANLTAVTAAARASGLPVHVICAGIHGQPCREDTICAGAIAHGLAKSGHRVLGADADLAIQLWLSVVNGPNSLAAALVDTEGGQNLLSAGLDADIPICAAVDSRPIIPEWVSSRRVLALQSRPR